MRPSAQFLNPSEAAKRLSVSTKALRIVRRDLAAGPAPAVGELAKLIRRPAETSFAFDLPWPWGGKRLELLDIRPLPSSARWGMARRDCNVRI